MGIAGWHKFLPILAAGLLSACAIGPLPTPSPIPNPSATARPAPGGGGAPSPVPVTNDYLHGVTLPPLCPTSANDIPTCQVKLAAGDHGGSATPTGRVGAQWSATSSESILFRIGDAETTQAQCQAFLATTTSTMTLDGVAVAFVRLPCVVVPPGEVGMETTTSLWWTDTRYLSAPLSPGTHTARTTVVNNTPFTYTAGCTNTAGCTSPAGTTSAFSVIVTVS